MSSRSSSAQFVFTVFTPTFNRAHTLRRLFDSLTAQSFRSFEWLIIDDGSSDGTEQLLAELERTATFSMRFFSQPNAGKHAAFDRAVDLARGELFLPVDSDDTITANALERLVARWDEIPEAERHRYSGVTAACMDEAGRPVGMPLPRTPLDCSAEEAVFRWKVRGERFGFHRTTVLRSIRFPVGGELKFVPEGVLWFAIGRRFLTRFVDEPLRCYFTDGHDRLTVRASLQKGAGFGYYSQTLLLYSSRFAFVAPVAFFKAAVQFVRYRALIPSTLVERADSFPVVSRFLVLLARPVAALLRLNDERTTRRS